VTSEERLRKIDKVLLDAWIAERRMMLARKSARERLPRTRSRHIFRGPWLGGVWAYSRPELR
jgi:hypothetical protein